MPLRFNTILQAEGFDPVQVRLLRHKDNRADKGRGPYELWRDNPEKFERYQEVHSVRREAHLRAAYWAAFVGSPADETLFVGMYKVAGQTLLEVDRPMIHTEGVDLAGTCHIYSLVSEPRMRDLIGKLLIEWGPGDRSWIQRPDRQDKVVVELRREFKDPPFPGYLHFVQSLSELQALPPGWIDVLRAARGIYLLTCPKTREQYVGSATGDGGFWRRWLDYAASGHGGNVGLKSSDPSDYRVSILEVAGTAATLDDILKVETLWKRKLQSIEMGLNRN